MDEQLEVTPENRTYFFLSDEDNSIMPDKIREAALERIAKMTEKQKEDLVYLPVAGWENERILLSDEATYYSRNGAERRASARVTELQRIREMLQEMFADLSIKGPDRNGDTLKLIKRLMPEIDLLEAENADLRKSGNTEKRKSVAEMAKKRKLQSNTLSGYITELRKKEAELPEDQRKINTPPRGRYSYQEELAIDNFIDTKNQRLKARAANKPKT